MNQTTYLIGEIGQNHNGSPELAKLIVDVAARSIIDPLFQHKLKGMDAVKLTKRDLNYELSVTSANRIYNSPHSFGHTYGEHRAALELSDIEHYEIYLYAKEKGLDFIETLCAPSCLSVLKHFTPDKLKIASRDLTNIPLLSALAETGLPIILSTGMAGKEELDNALNEINRYHNDISILHCVSEYPTNPLNVNLNTILYLKENYPQYTVGYSDHTIGIATPLAAVSMGANIIEKHLTLDRKMKGTDQAGSLGIDGAQRMVRDIRLLELSFGKKDLFIDPSVELGKIKLERSLATNKILLAGSIIKDEDLHLLSPGDGFKYTEKSKIIGKKLVIDIVANEIIYSNYLE
ncbi:N-acetylneuraminate synthase family protein [Gillisia sp. M10.2A]|uniref:N-acetylneuraminate synthase family protein n=1 Tax=Gillisia lutea TaxID=2909668 RepID=A0ABS9EK16_9FLAO|nr:N-acetylneuraminate synthase family protein [Gillisia lutea]MCF4102667.1 N-acetylneuraminate synthase family protein [Gillisia lutea]